MQASDNHTLKRPHSVDEDDIDAQNPFGEEDLFAKDQRDFDEDDDNVSLVSRSPSPVSGSNMDIDKYDEYVAGPAREVITVETRIKPSNVGFAMLAKMGWSEGQSLGLSGNGRLDPIPFSVKSDTSGLGKLSQDVRMIEETVSQRRNLEAERQLQETQEQRQTREAAVARQQAVRSEVSSTLQAFYCALCDKQFKNVAQYDEHTNSYAHHHKVREKDMRASMKGPAAAHDERKERERKREEKEMRKLAKAAGIKMPLVKPSPSVQPSGAAAQPSITAESSTTSKGGWASVAPSVPSDPSPPSIREPAASSFRSGGWSSLEAEAPSASMSHDISVPPPPSYNHQPSPAQDISSTPAPPPKAGGGWATLGPAPGSQSTHSPISIAGGNPAVPASTTLADISTASASIAPPDQAPTNAAIVPAENTPTLVPATASKPRPPVKAAAKAAQAEGKRSGWQNFKAGRR